MKDLFGTGRHAGRPGRTAAPAPSSAPIAEPAPQEIGPPFGSRAWTRCRCGRPASLHFPKAGGIRRCNACALAEGRWMPSEPIWNRASTKVKDQP